MESILPFIGVAAFVLICPLMMVAIGGIGWLVARARGQKGSFSSCLTGHGGHHQAAATDKADLSGEVARLQSEGKTAMVVAADVMDPGSEPLSPELSLAEAALMAAMPLAVTRAASADSMVASRWCRI